MKTPSRSLLAICLATFVACAYASTVVQHDTPTSIEQALNPAGHAAKTQTPLPESTQQQALEALTLELQRAQFRCSDDEVLAAIAQRLQTDKTTARNFRDALLETSHPAYTQLQDSLNTQEADHLQEWLMDIAATEPSLDALNESTMVTASLP